MKLNELFTDVENLNEVFNTHVDIDSWKFRNNSLIGTLNVNNETFEIEFEPKKYSINNKQFTFINIAFSKLIDGHSSQALQNNSTSPSMIIGAITNAIIKKLDEFNYDAVIFVAIDNIDKRMRIYNAVAKKFAQKFSWYKTHVKIPNGELTILATSSIKYEEFEQHLKDVSK